MGRPYEHQLHNHLSRHSSSIYFDSLEAMDCAQHHHIEQLNNRCACSNLQHGLATMVREQLIYTCGTRGDIQHCLGTMDIKQLIISNRSCSGLQHRMGSMDFEQLIHTCGTCPDLFVFSLGGMEPNLKLLDNHQPRDTFCFLDD